MDYSELLAVLEAVPCYRDAYYNTERAAYAPFILAEKVNHGLLRVEDADVWLWQLGFHSQAKARIIDVLYGIVNSKGELWIPPLTESDLYLIYKKSIDRDSDGILELLESKTQPPDESYINRMQLLMKEIAEARSDLESEKNKSNHLNEEIYKIEQDNVKTAEENEELLRRNRVLEERVIPDWEQLISALQSSIKKPSQTFTEIVADAITDSLKRRAGAVGND